MLTGAIKNQVDQLWNAFWSGGISNPIEVIEQITYLLFIRRLDDLHIRFDRVRMDPEFALHFLNSVSGRRHLVQAGNTTSGLNTISVADVRQVPVPVPPLSDQNEFVRRVRGVGRERAAGLALLGALDTLFITLQHLAFRGEL